MKVIHVTHTELSRDFRILNELRSLIGFEGLKLLATTADKNFRSALPDDYGKDLGRLQTLRLPRFSKMGPIVCYVLNNLYVCIKLIQLRPQVIHFHDTYFIPGIRIVALFLRDVRLIYDSHELNELRASKVSWYPLVSYFLERLIWRKLHSVIAVNKGIADYLELRHGTKKSIEILNIPWGYSNERFSRLTKVTRTKRIKVCFVGYLVEGRELDWIVDFFINHEEFDLHLYGSGNLEEYLEAKAARAENITFYGFISPEHLSEYLMNMDIGLCLINGKSYSQYLALPNKIFDFLSSGLRVVSYPNPEIVRFFRNDNRIFYIDKDRCQNELLSVLRKPIKENVNKVKEYPTWIEQGHEIRNLYN